ncbi:MAG TPA: hypothetical protein VJ573_03140 [Actinomycetota bacterium]|nr:hypothetical protein [Actinomycetota bacterium]
METRLRTLLHELATKMPVDVQGTAPKTVRRARGRRLLNASAGVAIAVAIVVVSASALPFGEEPTVTPAVTGPNPSATFEGLWPETNPEALAETQAAVEEGHYPLQASPEGIASLLAVDVLGWEPGDDQASNVDVRGSEAEVVISNQTFAASVPPVIIEARQLGRTGPRGVWSVVDVSTALIRLDEVTEVAPGKIRIAGRVDDLYDGAPAIEAHVFDGPTLDPSLGTERFELTDRTFAFDVEVSPTPDGRATLLLTMPDAVGASLGAVMVAVPTPVGEPAPRDGPNLDGVPSDVAVTAQLIYDAALAGDVDALAPLLDPNTFAYNFDDGSDPIPAWREDPSVLGPMAAVLELPAAEPRKIRGYGTLTIWPYLIDTDFEALTERERADLGSLGYSEGDIQLMIDGGFGYQGPRLAIDETGLWRSFTTMGE